MSTVKWAVLAATAALAAVFATVLTSRRKRRCSSQTSEEEIPARSSNLQPQSHPVFSASSTVVAASTEVLLFDMQRSLATHLWAHVFSYLKPREHAYNVANLCKQFQSAARMSLSWPKRIRLEDWCSSQQLVKAKSERDTRPLDFCVIAEPMTRLNCVPTHLHCWSHWCWRRLCKPAFPARARDPCAVEKYDEQTLPAIDCSRLESLTLVDGPVLLWGEMEMMHGQWHLPFMLPSGHHLHTLRLMDQVGSVIFLENLAEQLPHLEHLTLSELCHYGGYSSDTSPILVATRLLELFSSLKTLGLISLSGRSYALSAAVIELLSPVLTEVWQVDTTTYMQVDHSHADYVRAMKNAWAKCNKLKRLGIVLHDFGYLACKTETQRRDLETKVEMTLMRAVKELAAWPVTHLHIHTTRVYLRERSRCTLRTFWDHFRRILLDPLLLRGTWGWRDVEYEMHSQVSKTLRVATISQRSLTSENDEKGCPHTCTRRCVENNLQLLCRVLQEHSRVQHICLGGQVLSGVVDGDLKLVPEYLRLASYVIGKSAHAQSFTKETSSATNATAKSFACGHLASIDLYKCTSSDRVRDEPKFEFGSGMPKFVRVKAAPCAVCGQASAAQETRVRQVTRDEADWALLD